MSLHTLSDVYHRICQYIYDNSRSYDFEHFVLTQNAGNSLKISKWDYLFSEPKLSDLKDIDYSPAVSYFNSMIEINKVVKLPALTTQTIESSAINPKDGMLVFDTVDRVVKVYHSNAWHPI